MAQDFSFLEVILVINRYWTVPPKDCKTTATKL